MTNLGTETVAVLLIEDNPGDVDLLHEALADAAITSVVIKHEERLETGLKQLEAIAVDLILLDLSLPDARGLESVRRAHRVASETPIVVLTSLDDEDYAMEALRLGAQDYVIKDGYNGRGLMRAMRHAIERKRLENEKARLIVQLQEALAQIKTLTGLLPICAWCKKIRDDRGYWNQIEDYIAAHSDAEFSHGICDGCADSLVLEAREES